jgi:hypothetical protein
LPDELDQIRQRLVALESQVNSEAGLRAMMDHDQAWLTTRLDAQDNLLRALSITQSEHGMRFNRIEGRLSGVEERLSRVEERQGSLEVVVGRVEVGVQAILALLGEDR